MAIHRYWLDQAPAPGRLPGRADIDPIDIPMLLDNVWLLDVVGAPPRFRLRLVGGVIHRAGVAARVGAYLDEYVAPAELPGRQMRFAVAERMPVWFRGEAYIRHRAKMFTLERIFLPLAADGATVDMMLCLTVYYRLDGSEI